MTLQYILDVDFISLNNVTCHYVLDFQAILYYEVPSQNCLEFSGKSEFPHCNYGPSMEVNAVRMS